MIAGRLVWRSVLGALCVVVVGFGPLGARAASAGPDGARRPAASRHLADASAKPHVRPYTYGVLPQQKLTAYWYDDVSRPRPVVVMVHGGYWDHGARSEFYRQGLWWARQGFVVVAMDYRYSTRARWPAQRTDVLDVLRWVRGHAGDLHADAHRMVLLGSSSGGQLAVATGTYGCGGCRVRGVVGLSPVAEPLRSYLTGLAPDAQNRRRRLATGAVRLAGCTPSPVDAVCRNQWIDMTAQYQASTADPPMLLIHSKHDLVPARQSRELRAALGAHQVRARVVVVPGKRHGSGLFKVAGVRATVLAWIRARVLPDRPRER